MHGLKHKFIAAALIAGAGLLATPAFARCYVSGEQTAPPHNNEDFKFGYAFSGSPLGTLQQCLSQGAHNEDIVLRDVQSITMEYHSSSRGNFAIRGYAAQPGDDLDGVNKPFNSVAIGVISSESGVAGLNRGNIVEYALQNREVEIYRDWAAFKAASPNAALFSRQP